MQKNAVFSLYLLLLAVMTRLNYSDECDILTIIFTQNAHYGTRLSLSREPL